MSYFCFYIVEFVVLIVTVNSSLCEQDRPTLSAWESLRRCYHDITQVHVSLGNYTSEEVFEPYLYYVKKAYDQWLLEKKLTTGEEISYVPFDENSFENSVLPLLEIHCRYVVEDFTMCIAEAYRSECKNPWEEESVLQKVLHSWSSRYCVKLQVKTSVLEDFQHNFLVVFGTFFDFIEPNMVNSTYIKSLNYRCGSLEDTETKLFGMTQKHWKLLSGLKLIKQFLMSYLSCGAALYQQMFAVDSQLSQTLNTQLNVVFASENKNILFQNEFDGVTTISLFGSDHLHLNLPVSNDVYEMEYVVCVPMVGPTPESLPVVYLSNAYLSVMFIHVLRPQHSAGELLSAVSEVNILFWNDAGMDAILISVSLSESDNIMLHNIRPDYPNSRLVTDYNFLADKNQTINIYDTISTANIIISKKLGVLHLVINLPKTMVRQSVGAFIRGCPHETHLSQQQLYNSSEKCKQSCTQITDMFLKDACYYDCSEQRNMTTLLQVIQHHSTLLKEVSKSQEVGWNHSNCIQLSYQLVLLLVSVAKQLY